MDTGRVPASPLHHTRPVLHLLHSWGHLTPDRGSGNQLRWSRLDRTLVRLSEMHHRGVCRASSWLVKEGNPLTVSFQSGWRTLPLLAWAKIEIVPSASPDSRNFRSSLVYLGKIRM